MAEWGTFAGFAGVVLTALLFLAYVSQGSLSGAERESSAESDPDDAATDADAHGPVPAVAPDAEGDDGDEPSADAPRRRPNGGTVDRSDAALDAGDDPRREDPDGPAHRQLREMGDGTGELSTGMLLVNVALSQGFLGGLLVLGAWYTGVPLSALGLGPAAFAPAVLLAGVGVGVGLYVANEVGAAVGERFGLGGSEELRSALAPDSARGWVLLFGGVLPVIAAFEEFLFRAVLVGAFATGFGVSPWVLAVLSSVAFAAGHGAQGPAGVAVTGALGFVLAAAFVLTGSLAAVVVAHYLVNALEFAVHEGLGVEWTDRGGGRADGG